MATLKITNLKKLDEIKTDLWETGLKAVKDATALADDTFEDHLPVNNTAEFAGTVEIPVYGNNNQYIRIAAGAENAVTVVIGETEAEKQFYQAMATETLIVEEVEAEAAAE